MTGIGSFDQKVTSIVLIIFYSAVLIITGLLHYNQKSAEAESYFSSVDRIAEYLK